MVGRPYPTATPCPAAYATPGFTTPANYSASVAKVEYWIAETPFPSPVPTTIGGVWVETPCPLLDSGVQRLTLRVQTPDGKGDETVQVVKRK
jgi:hypothetical protein